MRAPGPSAACAGDNLDVAQELTALADQDHPPRLLVWRMEHDPRILQFVAPEFLRAFSPYGLFGSPGRIRTIDQPVNRNLDASFNRLQRSS
jgi:hypothetical protein